MTPRSFVIPIVLLVLVSTAFAASQETVLHSFLGKPGTYPYAGLVADSAGNLYGTTRFGGCDGCGLVFQLQRIGKHYKYNILHVFRGAPDAKEPDGALVLDSKGNLYGTARGGGTYNHGAVFELSPTKSGSWIEKVLYSFGHGADGNEPQGALIFDQFGNLYGTTYGGGIVDGGIAFELSPSAESTWTETILHDFTANGTDGYQPNAAVTLDGKGNLYGTTAYGGGTGCATYGCGTVFELSPSANGSWTEKVLYSFTGGSDGRLPFAVVTFDSAGNLYSTASAGGNFNNQCPYGCGTVFEMSPQGDGTWKFNSLHAFSSSDGKTPSGGVIFDATGNLYGTTFYGGGGVGVIYELTVGKNKWTEKVLYNFTKGNDGGLPFCDLIWDSSGNLYGTTVYGGTKNVGVVFKLKP